MFAPKQYKKTKSIVFLYKKKKKKRKKRKKRKKKKKKKKKHAARPIHMTLATNFGANVAQRSP